jgi:uncharacterized membrane protein
METDILGRTVKPDDLRLLAQEGAVSSDELEQALRIAAVIPGGRDWSRFLNMLFLLLGSVLLAAGVIFFFAYNWASMHRLLKLGVLQLALLAAVMTTSYLGFERPGGKASLLVASLLTGALLALYGQIYQTGADAYELFLGWAALIAGWVVIGNFAPLWLLLLLLLEAALYLYWGQVLGSGWFVFRSPVMYEFLFGMNAMALGLWEFFSSRGVPWLAGRWAPRTILNAGLFFLMVPLIIYIIMEKNAFPGERGSAALLPVLYFCSVGLILWFYRVRTFDLYMIAAALLSLIVLISVFFGHAIGSNYGGFLLLSMIIVALSGGAAVWLRSLARTRTPEAP